MDNKAKRYVYLVTIGYESTGEQDQYIYSALSRAKRKLRTKFQYLILGSNRYKKKRPDLAMREFRSTGEMFFRVEQEDDEGMIDCVFGRIEKKELL